jgi:hypothetical protein
VRLIQTWRLERISGQHWIADDVGHREGALLQLLASDSFCTYSRTYRHLMPWKIEVGFRFVVVCSLPATVQLVRMGEAAAPAIVKHPSTL